MLSPLKADFACNKVWDRF